MAEQVTSPPSGPSATPPGGGEPAAPEPGVPFTLDGRPATARRGEMLISAAERAGTYIPRFCYHPRMKPVGMCRMCLVEVSGPRGATLQPACFIAATEGMEVVTDSEKVKKAQDGVLEFLLVNHPLDCPVCDKGGECPLQDQTLAYGPGESRFVEEKRHFDKPIAISDLVLLDRERCIQCARCTRFAEEVAGEAQIDFAGRGEHVEVATFPDEPFSSYFSGNTVQICPVGALTATPYRFTARPWDLDQVESTCTTCALGCRVAVQSSANRLTRLLGIDADPVNQGWLCDKGRFVFESVNGDEVSAGPLPAELADEAVDVVPATASQVESLPVVRGQFLGEAKETGASPPTRLTEPMVRKEGELTPVSWSEALAVAAAGLAAARDAGGPGAVAVLGGARSTNEGAYAWAKLAKGVLGTDSVDAQLGDGLPAELVLALPRATIDQACSAKTVVLLTGDVREELPVLFLRLRRAALDGETALVELAPRPTSLTRYAAVSLATRPGDAPVLVRALTGDAGAASSLQSHPEGPAWSPTDLDKARSLLGLSEGQDVPAGTSPGGPGSTTAGVGQGPHASEEPGVGAPGGLTSTTAGVGQGPHASEEPGVGAPGGPGSTTAGVGQGPHASEEPGVGAPGGLTSTTAGVGQGPHASEEPGVGAPGGPGSTTAGVGQGPHASEEPGVGAPGGPGSTVVVILGRPSLAEHEGVVAEAARALAAALPGARFLPALRRGNVHGALDMGLAPGILPGRVSLAAGGEWFAAGWGSVPAERGLGAAEVLASLAGDSGGGPDTTAGVGQGPHASEEPGLGRPGGPDTTAGVGQGPHASEEPGLGRPGGPDTRIRALVALGADVTDDFPDHDLATRALAGADFVVAVTGHPSATADRADVVLPAAVAHERPGTTTNVEGRLSRLGQKLVAPGLAWPDWMIAAELAAELGGDLGVGSVGELWEEIERLAPAYAGITPAVLDSDAERDGVLVPFDAAARAGARPPEPIDPMALPGVESVERQGAPPRVGLAVLSDPPGAPLRSSAMAGSSDAWAPNPTPAVLPSKPAVLAVADAAGGEAPHVPAVDSYSLRLVSTRRLYDAGSAVAGSPSLASLVPTAVARANPYDLDRLGVATGDPVRVRSARTALVLPAEADGGVPRGVVAVEFNLPAPDGTAAAPPNAAAALIDAAAAVNDVRLESVR